MDFTNRPSHSQPAAAGREPVSSAPVNTNSGRHGRAGRDAGSNSLSKIGAVVFLICMVILAASAIALIGFSGNGNEGQYVTKSKYQAVFINGSQTNSGYAGGSVYFGHITKLTNNYLVLSDVYYLSSSSSDKNAQTQLTPLGCLQIHSPYDQMVVNTGQVAFWENLQDNGKVVQTINQYKKQYPNGPDCSQATNSTGAGSSASQSGAAPSSSSQAPASAASNPAATTKKP